jgi:hypothetical protein
MRKDAMGPERPRKRYRIRNWREYDRGLIGRGDLTLWFSSDLAWHAPDGTGKRGRPRVFSDAAIQCVVTLKVLFGLPLRAAQELVGSSLTEGGRLVILGLLMVRDKVQFEVAVPHGREALHDGVQGSGLPACVLRGRTGRRT